MRSRTALGQYLRARRELVRHEDVGLPNIGRRRVPGLRREELATLAGISADYYLRLEQGRDRNPSAQVIDALGRALQLDEDATVHLHALAQSSVPRRRPRQAEQPEQPPAWITPLIALWANTPAIVHGRRMDVLAANSLALALAPTVFTPGVNIVRATFLDPETRRLIGNWENVAPHAVARLRAGAGRDLEDPRLAELVGELSVRSDQFRRLWERHDIKPAPPPVRTFNHALVGSVELKAESLVITGADGQQLIVYHAEPGSPSERALAQLVDMAAG